MNDMQKTVIDLVAGILKISSQQVDLESRIDITSNWDSLTNMDILLEIENHFSVSFDALELHNLDSVRAICAKLERRLT